MNNYNYIVDFFKTMNLYNKEYFEMIKEKTTVLKGNYEDIKDFVGFYPKYDNGKLNDFKLYLPELVGLDNILIYIHIYGYALFPEDESEIFPNILEASFMNTYLMIPKKTQEQINRIEEKSNNSNSEKYRNNLTFKVNCLKYLK